MIKHPDLLMRIVCDESLFKKSKALRLESIKELVTIPIHSTNASKTTKVGALLQDKLRLS